MPARCGECGGQEWSNGSCAECRTAPTLGDQVADLIESACVIPDGERAGEAFTLTEEQLRFLLHFYRLDPLTGRFTHFRGAQLVRPQKWGKGPFSAAIVIAEAHPEGPVLFDGWDADGQPVGKPWPTPHIQITAASEDQPLALDTPVPTPAGWSTIGDLRRGDTVFAGDGSPTGIVRTTPVILGQPCYRVSFSDGEEIIASGRHGWTMERRRPHGDRHESVTLTTRELADEMSAVPSRGPFRVPSARWSLPDVPLPVHPYLLGLWLGDGSADDSAIAYDHQDRAEVERIITPLISWHEEAVWGGGRFRIRKRAQICPWGHDWSDDRVGNGSGRYHCGPCKRGGRGSGARLTTMRERLRSAGVLGAKHIPTVYLRSGDDQRLALLQGLIDSDGHITERGRVSFTSVDGQLARDVGELLTTLGFPWTTRFDGYAHRVFFSPFDARPVARLERKRRNQRVGGRRLTSRWRYVVAVDEVESVPVRCVGIDTADHLFLVGRRAVPTHNTANVWRALQPMVEMSPTLAAEIPDTGQTRINLHGGGRIEPVTSSARSRLGARVTFCLHDETHSWLESNGGRRLADTQRRNLAGMGGRWMETTNAWDPAEESVAQQTAEGNEPGVYRDDSEPGAGSVRNARDRRRLLRQVYGDSLRTRENPLGWIDLDRIEGEILSLLDRDPAQAERFFLNRKEAGESIAFNIERWDELATDHEAPAGELIVVGVDGARSRDALAMVACEVTTGHVWPLGIWERPEDAPPDYEHDRDEIDHAMREAMKRWSVWRVYVDPQHIEALLDRWQGRWGQDRVVPWYTARARQIAWAVRNFSEAIGAGDLSHDGDPVLRDHIRNSRRLRLNVRDDKGVAMHAISKDRSHSPRKIDGAMGAILAWEARGDAIAAGATAQKKRSRRLVAW